ncbi:TRAP transporter small permease [Magnetospira sp. QH-2]|uniref:TRAP transporter small permease n=1 Tax=Magnetospira sp. (strain QH-2) TaxID=1288970 RepID=UPI0003E80F56|nr:TRAP transporter small permease [Magnetospira sp. QH-2]CCQ73261.1 Putative tripartite ATP-independent periplasmic transporter, DctQ component [Magnetospira sp. QH-2]
MQKVIESLHRAEEGFLAFLLAAMTLLTFIQVVLRYAFNSGFIWALELTTFLFAWLVIFGVSYGIRIHSHIGVDAFVKLFPSAIQRILGLIAIAAGITYSTMMVIGGWEEVVLVWEINVETADLKWPMWFPLSVVVVGFGMAIIRLLVAGWTILTSDDTTLLGDEGEDALKQFAQKQDDDQETGK